MDFFWALERINTGDQSSINISETINLSKASCIPSAPIIILLMKQRSNAAWPFRTLERETVKTHMSCLCKKDLFFFLRRYWEEYNLTRKLNYWVLPTFLNVSSFLCVKVCTVGIWYVCTVHMTLTRKVRVLTHPTNFSIKSISQALNAWSIYIPTFG